MSLISALNIPNNYRSESGSGLEGGQVWGGGWLVAEFGIGMWVVWCMGDVFLLFSPDNLFIVLKGCHEMFLLQQMRKKKAERGLNQMPPDLILSQNS